MSQIKTDMQNLVDKDPVLKAFVSTDQPETPAAHYNRSNTWITLWTNKFNLENMEWNRTRELKETKDFKVSFLVVKKFDISSSSLIFNALKPSPEPTTSPPIIINKDGDVSIGGTAIGENGTTKYSRNTAGRNRPAPFSGQIDKTYIENNMVSWSTALYMSTDSKYILINTDDKAKVPSYVMVLNPLHSYNFKLYYRLAILNGNVKESGVFYENTPLRDAVVKYCNALVIPGKYNIRYHSGVSGQKPLVYVDPVCGVLVDDKTARFNKFYSTNITSWYYRNRFFNNNELGKKFTEYIEKITEERDQNRSFTCQENISSTSGPVTLYKLLKRFDQISKNSETFLFDLAIYANTTTDNIEKMADFDVSRVPTCVPRRAINVCEVNIYAAGDVINNQINNCAQDDTSDFKKQLDAIGGNARIPADNGRSGGGPKIVGKDKENSYKYIIIGIVILVVIIILGFILFGTSSAAVPAAVPAAVQSAVPAAVQAVSNVTAAFGNLF
jgi:YHS domain-containing protein